MRARLLSSFAILLAQVAVASPEFVPLQERAQGQSLTGSHLMNDSLYSNPAASAFLDVYSVDGTFAFPKSFAVSVLDTRTSNIRGAAGYFRTQYLDSVESRQGLKFAVGSRVTPTIGVAVGGKAIWGPTGLAQADGTFAKSDFKDVDVGVLWNLGSIQLGSVFRNVLGGKAEMDQFSELAYGGRIGYEEILFFSVTAVSKTSNVSPYQYGFGAEYVSPWFFSIKGGYRTKPSDNESFWSTGFSFLSPKMNIHYGVEFAQQGSESPDHLLGATFFF